MRPSTKAAVFDFMPRRLATMFRARSRCDDRRICQSKSLVMKKLSMLVTPATLVQGHRSRVVRRPEGSAWAEWLGSPLTPFQAEICMHVPDHPPASAEGSIGKP